MLEQDLKNAVKCNFDHLLNYFLYLVLEDNSKEKKDIDAIQEEVEKVAIETLLQD